MISAFKSDNPAYPFDYLSDIRYVQKKLFFRFRDTAPQYDTLSLIDIYLRTSPSRKMIDIANPRGVYKSSKQLFNEIDFSGAALAVHNDWYDNILLEWISDIYAVFQWKYNMSSSEISHLLPAQTVYDCYNPLHEVTLNKACEKLYERISLDKLKFQSDSKLGKSTTARRKDNVDKSVS